MPPVSAIVAAWFLAVPGPAAGTPDDLLKLPSYSTFQCAICHSVDRPSSTSAPLNQFGEDYKANGRVWNRTLALLNSDGDQCTNGFELDDLNGDGILDEPGNEENGNPGVVDCTIALTKQTWGIIKSIFSNE
ncbi:MAG: hypothetical protein HY770_04070 [Chitinivibrionia bacterium]|nr:hypothetical protein [Chitinivibrionia bacterium]